MKRRFDYNDENEDQDDLFPDTSYDGDDDFDEDYAEIIERSEVLDKMQLDLVQLDLNQRLLFKTMKMVKTSKKWKRIGDEDRLKMVAEAYAVFQQLVSVPKKEG